MAISKRLRYEVLRRDNHACRYCGGTAPDAKLTVDHVLPTALGGNDDPTNLVAACSDCNSGKSATSPDQALIDQVSHDAVRWSVALKQASAAMAAAESKKEDYVYAFLSGWEYEEIVGWLPDNWHTTLANLYAAGLPQLEMFRSIHITRDAQHVRHENKFRYFCGVAWKRVATLQEIARAIYEADQAGGA